MAIPSNSHHSLVPCLWLCVVSRCMLHIWFDTVFNFNLLLLFQHWMQDLIAMRDINRNMKVNDRMKPRILVLDVTADVSAQYIPVMNCVSSLLMHSCLLFGCMLEPSTYIIYFRRRSKTFQWMHVFSGLLTPPSCNKHLNLQEASTYDQTNRHVVDVSKYSSWYNTTYFIYAGRISPISGFFFFSWPLYEKEHCIAPTRICWLQSILLLRQKNYWHWVCVQCLSIEYPLI